MQIPVDIRQVIEKACASLQVGTDVVSLDEIDGTLRWISPFIPIRPEMPEQDVEFIVDFQLTEVMSVLEQYRTKYLTITLYLFGGDPNLLPRERSSFGKRLEEIDSLNREEPGVKFRFQPGSDSVDGGWIVIESDISIDDLQEERLAKGLDRVLECAEARYWEVYEWAIA
jgi:hypothetical protein